MSHAALGGQVSHAVHLSEPYDVLDVDVVADEVFLSLVGINYTHQSFAVLAEIIQEATVLTELVNVGGIVHGRVVVAHEENESTSDAFAKRFASVYVGLLAE